MRGFRQLAYCLGGAAQRHVGVVWMVFQGYDAISCIYPVRICAAVNIRRMALCCVPRRAGSNFSDDIDRQPKRDARDLVPFFNRAVARVSQSGHSHEAIGNTAPGGAPKIGLTSSGLCAHLPDFLFRAPYRKCNSILHGDVRYGFEAVIRLFRSEHHFSAFWPKNVNLSDISHPLQEATSRVPTPCTPEYSPPVSIPSL